MLLTLGAKGLECQLKQNCESPLAFQTFSATSPCATPNHLLPTGQVGRCWLSPESLLNDTET